MSLTTLNKVVALFLVGGFLLTILLAHHLQSISTALQSAQANKGSGIWVLAAFLILPVVASAGAVAEGISEASFQKLVRRSRKSRSIARFLRHEASRVRYVFWSDRVRYLLSISPRFQLILGDAFEDRVQSTSAAIFLWSANAENFSWMVRHYATFVMASNFAAVLSIGYIYSLTRVLVGRFVTLKDPPLLPTSPVAFALTSLLVFIATWSLCSIAASRFLYSHELFLRHSCLELTEDCLESSKDDGGLVERESLEEGRRFLAETTPNTAAPDGPVPPLPDSTGR